MFPLLPLIVVIPVMLILPLLLLPERHSFRVALLSSALVFALSACASYVGLTSGFGALSFSQSYLPSLGIDLNMQLTPYGNVFLVLSAVVLLAAAIAADGFVKESGRIYNFLFLIAESSAIGIFLSGSLFLFYVFWALGDAAMFFTIYVFGGFDRRYAAIKFMVYSAVASLLLLVGIALVYSGAPTHTFDIASLISQAASMPAAAQLTAAIFLALAFVMKMPVFPFHEWLPDACTEAPTPGGMVVAGVLSKAGAYGLLLMLLMLPAAAAYSSYLAVLFAFSALYAAAVAVRQPDLKRLVAYAGIIGTGIAAIGLVSANTPGTAGALYVLLGSGIAAAMMLLIAGAVDESYGTQATARIKGVLKSFPGLAYSFVFGAYALVGMPLTAGFMGYLLVFSGAFTAYGSPSVIPIAALVLLGASLLYVLERSVMNASESVEPYDGPRKSSYVAICLLIAATILLGVLPSLLLSPFTV